MNPFRPRPAPPVVLLVALWLAAGVPAQAADDPLPGPLRSDSTRVAALGRYLDRLEALGFSGQVVVAEQGRVLIRRALGWADRRYAVPMTLDTRLGIGSITKNFVAAAILRLETQGRLAVSDPIAKHLPGVPADRSRITIARLLCHTGGMRMDVEGIPDATPRDEVVGRMIADPLVETPGGAFVYSNSGYDVLAAIVERVSGTSFDAFVRREFLAPAGMTATGVAGSPGLPEGPAARGYDDWHEVAAWSEWPAGWKGTGSGRMVSTATDLWRWVEGVHDGRGLRAEEWKTMSSPHAELPNGAYGYGIYVVPAAGGGEALVMGGEVDGYRAEARWYPRFDRVVVVMSNLDAFGLGPGRRVVASRLSQIAQNQSPPLPSATRRYDPADRDASPVGSWHLPGGGEVDVWEELGQLRVGARGQDAVDLFEPDPGDSTGERSRVRRASETFLRAAVAGDSALGHSVLGPSEFAFAWPFLTRRLALLQSLHSGLQSVRGLGTVALPWDPRARRVHLKLHYLDRDVSLYFGWRGTELVDVVFDDDRPYPVIYPAAPLGDGEFVAWDLVREREVRFRLLRRESGDPRLILRAEAGEIAARRVR